MKPDFDLVNDILRYEPETGLLYWKKSLRKGFAGKVAGKLENDGYVRIGVYGKKYQAHLVAWLLMTGSWPEHRIDHENTVRSDNAWRNLREATQSQNIANASMRSNNTSGFKGVSAIKGTTKWLATIKVDGKSRWLGQFDTPEEAHEAYCRAAHEAFGEYFRAA